MNQLQVRDAKARLSEVLDAAERGEPTTITRHGKPAGVVVPVEMAKRMYDDQRSLLDVLMAMPEDLELDETSIFRSKTFG
jgi:prevent-host-death family protein